MLKKKRNKFSIDEREIAVLKVIEDGEPCSSVASQLQTSRSLVSRWVTTYKLHGKKGLSLKNNIRYTGEFKLQLIREMQESKLSLRVISSKYLITHSVISKWRRDYEQYGASVLFEDKRNGRPPKMKIQLKNEKVNSTCKYEELLDENLRLRAENDYLKKLHALIQKKEAQKKEKELKSSRD